MSDFNINAYLGTWYELMHYPSWFQRNDNYNTTAEYSVLPGEKPLIQVRNSTITQGKRIESIGVAKYLGGNKFHVGFQRPEVLKLQQSGEFAQYKQEYNNDEPNYIVDKYWVNRFGEYIFAVVTDAQHESLYVLSRYKHPSLAAYNEIMQYVVQNYDRDRLVQTPHFE